MAKNKEKQISKKHAEIEKEQRYLNILTRGYVLFVLAVYPLVVGSAGYDNIIDVKTHTYWAVTLIFLFAFLLFYLSYKLGLGKNTDGVKWYKKLNIVDWALIVFFITITISSILSPYAETWLGRRDRNDGWLTMFCMLACYFPVSRWYKPKQLDFSLYAGSAGILCIIGYLQFYGYDFLYLFPYNRSSYMDETGNPLYSGFSIIFRSTIGNINFLSMYVCLTILSFTVLYIKTKGPLRFLYLAASIMTFLMMLIGGSDGGKVGVLGAMLFLLPYFLCERKGAGRIFILSGGFGLSYVLHHWNMIYNIMPHWGDSTPIHDRLMRDNYFTLPLRPILVISLAALAVGILILHIKRWPKPKVTRFAGLAVTIIIIGGGLLGVEILGQNLPPQNRIYQAREVMHGRMEDDFGSYRGFIWRNTLEAIPNQPLFGTGQDTFLYALGWEFQEKSLELLGVVYDKAHNDFLQILLTNGIFGLIAYLALIASLILYSIKPAFNDTTLLMAFAAVLAYLGQSMFGIDSIVVTPLFWLIIAIIRNRQIVAADLNQ